MPLSTKRGSLAGYLSLLFPSQPLSVYQGIIAQLGPICQHPIDQGKSAFWVPFGAAGAARGRPSHCIRFLCAAGRRFWEEYPYTTDGFRQSLLREEEYPGTKKKKQISMKKKAGSPVCRGICFFIKHSIQRQTRLAEKKIGSRSLRKYINRIILLLTKGGSVCQQSSVLLRLLRRGERYPPIPANHITFCFFYTGREKTHI